MFQSPSIGSRFVNVKLELDSHMNLVSGSQSPSIGSWFVNITMRTKMTMSMMMMSQSPSIGSRFVNLVNGLDADVVEHGLNPLQSGQGL